MNKKIFLLTDYLNRFESKHDDFPYRSGMDKNKMKEYFAQNNFEVIFIPFSEVDFRNNKMKGEYVLYTSQEDPGYYYKSYIEDVVYGLEIAGAKLIPSFKYLRANNNKVFIEILRDQLAITTLQNIKSYHFGTLEECMRKADTFKYPVVIKGSEGAMSKNVALAETKNDLVDTIKKMAATRIIKEELRESIRGRKYKGYKIQSKFRKKYVVQSFIPDLKNDWKVYVFGEKIFVFYRPIFKERGFRASGGGYDNYYYGLNAQVVDGLFDFAFNIYKALDAPSVSLDIAFEGNEFYLLEFQLVYFGTAGILKKYSKEYFVKKDGDWVSNKNEGDIEKVYVESVVKYLSQ